MFHGLALLLVQFFQIGNRHPALILDICSRRSCLPENGGRLSPRGHFAFVPQ
ncbi:Hypothetical protein AT6N2_L2061 [Agrobacterium tumefaciens]|nr:Hypothetical protein AT6N2_L2061 [Agrobacterium tumefaciens]